MSTVIETGAPPAALPTVTENTMEYLSVPMVTPTGFREYDARWRYPEQVNLAGIQSLGLAFATQLHEMGVTPKVALGCDFRSYSAAIKQAFALGLVSGGAEVLDIGVGLSPMAYFSQFDLDAPAVAMVTASHNPNGWTGVKIGCERPLTHGPAEMGRLKEIVMQGQGVLRGGGSYRRVEGVRERYIADLIGGFRMSRPLKVVVACGNGAAGAFGPAALEAIGVEVVPLHTDLDYTFPNHNPNPEALEMLHAMAAAVTRSGADLAVGFDGDGDRCGVVDDSGQEIFADKVGVMLARDLIKLHPGATFVADVKSTGLFASDPELIAGGAKADYWKTGHSHMKRRVKELGALAGFEKSGHYFMAEPIGRGYDDGIRVAIEICKMMDRNPGRAMSDLHAALPKTYATPTMSPACADEVKYEVIADLTQRLAQMGESGGELAGRKIEKVVTVNGARVLLEGGAWALVRASSNTPNLVVVCESPNSDAEMREVFQALDAVIRARPEVGAYDQTI